MRASHRRSECPFVRYAYGNRELSQREPVLSVVA